MRRGVMVMLAAAALALAACGDDDDEPETGGSEAYGQPSSESSGSSGATAMGAPGYVAIVELDNRLCRGTTCDEARKPRLRRLRRR